MGLLLLMGDSGFRGALDTLGSGLESAWSVGRRLRAAYTGAIIRVRRSSDNTEQDFSGSGVTGAVDPAAVAAFCGAGDGFLTTIYGQSEMSRNLTQSSTTIQPQVVSSGVAVTQNGFLACSTTTAAARSMSVASSTAVYNFLHTTGGTLYVVHKSNDTAAVKTLLRNNASNTGQAGFQLASDANEAIVWRSSKVDSGGVSTNGNSILINPAAGTGSTNARLNSVYADPDNATANLRGFVWQDGSQSATANAQTGAPFVENASGDFTLLGQPGGLQPYDGTFCELVIWSGDRTANREAWEANAKTFWGTP